MDCKYQVFTGYYYIIPIRIQPSNLESLSKIFNLILSENKLLGFCMIGINETSGFSLMIKSWGIPGFSRSHHKSSPGMQKNTLSGYGVLPDCGCIVL